MVIQAPTEEQPVVDLSVEACWRLLAAHQVGRLAYRLVDEVHVVPLNYAVHRPRILFRTAAGNKLLAAALRSEVALEIDRFGAQTAWSVLARGRLRRLEEDEQERVAELLPPEWLPTFKYDALELVPAVVTGRCFLLRRPDRRRHPSS